MQRYIIFFAVVGMLATTSCNKSVSSATDNLPALNPTNEDLGAGSWKQVLLRRPDTFSVATPVAVTSPAYVADLNEIKAYQHNMSSTVKDQIKYWSAGHVLRWNETMLGLMAKYNLPTVQAADGSYPIPNSANPFAYPLF